MKYGSVCSGIEAATVAWHPLGWKAQWFSEIESFPSKLLNHYYPHVPNLGDMTKLNEKEEYNQSTIDVLVGGTPCQSFSIAGLRNGMADERGNLSLEYCKILLRKQPKWFVWENVPGVFSSFSNDTKGTVEFKGKRWSISSGEYDITNTSDFATLLAAFQQCGYSFAYRVFDSKHFGVPQRRRRVFVVGHLGNDWRPSTAVLFERDSLRRDFTPRKEEGKGITNSASGRIGAYGIKSTAIGRKPENGGNGLGISIEESDTLTKSDRHGVFTYGSDLSQRPDKIMLYDNESATLTKGGTAPGFKSHVIISEQKNDSVEGTGCIWPANTASTLNANFGSKQGLDNQHINSGAPLFVPYILPHGQGDAKVSVNECPTLTCNHEQPILFNPQACKVADTLTVGANQTNGFIGEICTHPRPFGVRRLTPLECERLQGFPDNYTNIPNASDGPRYAALGNSMTVNVMKWIGERIDLVDGLIEKLKSEQKI